MVSPTVVGFDPTAPLGYDLSFVCLSQYITLHWGLVKGKNGPFGENPFLLGKVPFWKDYVIWWHKGITKGVSFCKMAQHMELSPLYLNSKIF